MKKINENGNVIITQMLDITPAQLRTIAERIEQAQSQQANPGDVILYPLHSGVYLFYDPKVLRGDLEKRITIDKHRVELFEHEAQS